MSSPPKKGGVSQTQKIDQNLNTNQNKNQNINKNTNQNQNQSIDKDQNKNQSINQNQNKNTNKNINQKHEDMKQNQKQHSSDSSKPINSPELNKPIQNGINKQQKVESSTNPLSINMNGRDSSKEEKTKNNIILSLEMPKHKRKEIHRNPSEDNSEASSLVDDNSASLSLQQTYLIENEGHSDILRTEEHFSSEIKSFVVVNPPKFKQRIKAYRLQPTDKVTLVAEVQSWPIAEFEWFCNDKPVVELINESPIFTVRTLGNVSIMHIQNPVEGIYTCAAKNSAGVSKSYGYIKINDSQNLKQSDTTNLIGILSPPPTPTTPGPTPSKRSKRPPAFLIYLPNLTVMDKETAIFDVQVRPVADSYIWYLDGRQIAELISANLSEDGLKIETAEAVFFLPKPGHCIAHFKDAKTGRYTCVAKNEAGIAKSTGFVERISDLNSICNIHSNLLRETTLPPLSTEGRGNSRERYSASRTKTTIHTTTVVHRSSSLPKRKASGESSRADSEIDSSLLVRPKSATPENFTVDDTKTPIIPNFVVFPPPQIYLSKQTKKPFELHVACQSNPPAQINWLINGKGLAEELKENEFRVLSEHNESRLLIECCGEGNELKEGIYTAEASNAYGTAKCETLVTISSDDALSTIEENGTDESENVTKIIQKRVERQEMFDEESDEEEDEFSIKNEREKEEDQELPHFFVRTETTEEPLIEEVEQIHPLQQKRPKIVLAPESRIFVPGGLPLVLELKTESESDCTIRWYLRNFELHPNGNNIITEQLERNNEKLTIQNPTEGMYKAVIQNDHGMATFECRVLVEVPPQSDDLPEFMQRSRDLLLKSPTPPPIFKPEKQRKKLTSDAVKRIDIAPKIINDFEEVYRLGENMPLELEVKAEARPEAQFQWKHNNFEIKPNDQIKIKHIGENQEQISFVRAIDGIVEVHAVNKLGKDIKRTKIIIDYDFEPSKNVIKKLSERRVDDELENDEQKIKIDKKLEIEGKETDELEISEQTDLENKPDKKKLKKKKTGKEKQLAKTLNENELINITKEEETYSLLIKVAESMADTLVANIFVNAIEEASQQLINSEKANKKKTEAQTKKKKQKEENNASKIVASLEIVLVNDKLTDNLDIMANIQMFELESEVKNVLPSMFTPKNKEKKKVASKQENEITKAKEASDKTEKSESINNEEISEEELAARLSQRRPSQQQLNNVNLQDMELLELVNRLRTVEGFLNEGEKNFPTESEKEEKIGEAAKIGENEQKIVFGDDIASIKKNEEESKVKESKETKEEQKTISNDLKDEINEKMEQSVASIKDNEILEIKEEKPEISSDISEKEAKLRLEIEQKIKQHRNEIEAQIAAKASNRPPSRSRAEIQIVVIEQEKTPPERKPEQPPAQAIPYGGKPKINKITLGVFLSLPPHVVSFNVYLLEANNEYVSNVIKMDSKKRSKSVDSIKLEEKQKLLQQPELLQKQNEEFKVKQEKIISQPEMLQKSKDDFQEEKQIEEKPIEKPIISIDEASPKNEKSLLESEGYFSEKLKEDEAKDVNSQMLVRLKPEVSLEKSEAEPLSDISERTEDISEASKVSSVPKRRKSKPSLESELINTNLTFVRNFEGLESEAKLLEYNCANAIGITRKIPIKSTINNSEKMQQRILPRVEEPKLLLQEKKTSDLFSLEQLFQVQFATRCGAKLEINKSPECANIEVIVADFLLEKVESDDKKPISNISSSYEKPEFLEKLPSEPIELLEGERQVLHKCVFKGTPIPTVTWWIGNELISENSFVDCIVDDCTTYLVAQKVPMSWDGKEISCGLRSSAGMNKCKSGTIRVLGNTEINAEFVLNAIDKPQPEGAEHSLKTFYSARYGRKKHQKPTTSNVSAVERRLSRESLSTVLERLDERRGNRPTTITRPNMYNGIPPFFIVSLAPSLYLNEGQSITLFATCVGANRLIWKKNASILVGNDDKYQIDTEMSSGKTRLTILNLNIYDEASYSCEGINEYGRATTECKVTTESYEMCESEADIHVSCKKIDSEAHIEIGVLEAIKETLEINIKEYKIEKSEKKKIKKSVTFEAEEVNLRVDINFEDVDVLDVNLYESFEEVISEKIKEVSKESIKEIIDEKDKSEMINEFTLEVEINYETTDMLEIYLYETFEYVEKIISNGDIIIVKKKVDADSTKKDDELAAKKKDDEMAAKKKDDELAAKQKDEEMAAKKKDDEMDAKKKIDELAAKKKDDELAAKKDDELAAKKKIEEIPAKKKDDEMASKKKHEKKKLEDARKKLFSRSSSIDLDLSLTPLHLLSEFPLGCLLCKEDYDQDSFAEINRIIRQKKLKTERIGIGVCFNSDMKINEIEKEEHLINYPQEEYSELAFYYSDFNSASIDLAESVLKPKLISEELEEPQEKRQRKIKKKKVKNEDISEKIEEKIKAIDELNIQIPSQLDVNNISRNKSPKGTQYLNVDVDIEAGEEASSTDGIIELEQIEYAESETSIHPAEEDFMDVDVILEDLKQEDRIETVLPVSPNFKDISESISLSKEPIEKVFAEEGKYASLDVFDVEIAKGAEQPKIQQEEKEPSPKVPEKKDEEKKKKKIPSALFIPKEINSLYGDPSVKVSPTVKEVEEERPTKQAEVVSAETVIEEKKKEPTSLQKKKMEEEQEKAKKLAEEKKLKENEEKQKKENEAKKRKEELLAKKKREEEEKKLKDKKEEPLRKQDDSKKDEDEKRKKDREETLRKRREAEEKSKLETNEAKAKMDELAKKRKESSLKKEEDEKKLKAEQEENRKKSIEEKKLAEDNAKEEAEAARKKALEEQKEIDTTVKKYVLEEEERPKSVKDDKTKIKEKEEEKPETITEILPQVVDTKEKVEDKLILEDKNDKEIKQLISEKPEEKQKVKFSQEIEEKEKEVPDDLDETEAKTSRLKKAQKSSFEMLDEIHPEGKSLPELLKDLKKVEVFLGTEIEIDVPERERKEEEPLERLIEKDSEKVGKNIEEKSEAELTTFGEKSPKYELNKELNKIEEKKDEAKKFDNEKKPIEEEKKIDDSKKKNEAEEEKPETMPTKLAKVDDAEKEIREKKNEPTSSMKRKMEEEQERARKLAEKKKQKEEEEKDKKENEAKKRREELLATKKKDDEENKFKDVKEEPKIDDVKKVEDDKRKKDRDETLRKRREAEEKSKLEANEAKAKMDELAKKRKESALKKEEDEKKRKAEEEEKRKKSLEEKKLAEQRAKDEAEAARKKAMEKQKEVDTTVKKLLLDEEERPKRVKDDQLKITDKEEEKSEAMPTKLAKVDDSKEEIETKKKEPISSMKRKMEEEQEKARKLAEQKKLKEEEEKNRKEDETKKRREELLAKKKKEEEEKKFKDKKEEPLRKLDDSKKDEKKKKDREETLRKRREAEEKSKSEADEAKSKMDELVRKRKESALKKEEDEKKRKIEDEEKRKKSIEEKKLAEDKAKEEADAARRKALEEQKEIDTSVKKYVLEEEERPKSVKDDQTKIKKKEEEKPELIPKEALEVETSKLDDAKKKEPTSLMKRKMEEEQEKARKLAEQKKLKEEEKKQKKENEAKKRREELLAKRKKDEEEKKLKDKKEEPLRKQDDSKKDEDEKRKKDSEEILKKRRESEEKSKSEADEAKAKMDELARKRKESALKKEEDEKKLKAEQEEKRKKSLEEKKLAEQRANEEAESARRKALEEQNQIDTTVKKFVLDEEEMPKSVKDDQTKNKEKEEQIEAIPTKLAKVDDMEKEVEEKKKEPTSLHKKKMEEEQEKAKKLTEEKKQKEEKEKKKREDEARQRREELIEKTKKEEEENKLKDVKDGTLKKSDGAKKEEDEKKKKDREETLRKRREAEEKSKSEADEAKAKMDELAKKRKESALKKEEDEKKLKAEQEEKRKKSLEEKKLAEQRAKEEAEAARKKALEEQKEIDTSVKKYVLEEEERPKYVKDDKTKIKEKEEEKPEELPTKLAKVDVAETEIGEKKKEPTSLMKRKMEEEQEKAKKLAEEKKLKEEEEKKSKENEAKNRREELLAKKKKEEEEKKLKDVKEEPLRKQENAKKDEDDKRKKDREEILRKRREAEEKSKSEADEAKAKMDELAKKRKDSALKKEEDEKKRKIEDEEKRKKSLEEKKLAEQRAKEESEAARKKALEEQKEVDTSVKKFVLEEEERPKSVKDDKTKIKEKEEEKPETITEKPSKVTKEEIETKKKEPTSLLKKKMEEEQEKAKKLAEEKKLKEDEEKQRKENEAKNRREELLAKKKKDAEEKKNALETKRIEEKDTVDNKKEEENKNRKERDEALRKRNEAEQNSKAAEDEAKNKMEEMKKRREEAKKIKEEEDLKKKEQIKIKEKLENEERQRKVLEAKKEADEEIKKAKETKDKQKGVETLVEKIKIEEKDDERDKQNNEAKEPSVANDREERRKALEKMKLEREEAKKLKLGLSDKKKEEKQLTKEEELKKKEMEEIRKKDTEEAEKKKKEAEKKKTPQREIEKIETDKKEEKRLSKDEENELEKFQKEREFRLKKRKEEEENARKEQEEAIKKMETAKAKTLADEAAKKEEQERRLKQIEEENKKIASEKLEKLAKDEAEEIKQKMQFEADDVDKMAMKRKTMKKQKFDKDEMPEDQKVRESLAGDDGQFVMAGALKVETRKAPGEEEEWEWVEEESDVIPKKTKEMRKYEPIESKVEFDEVEEFLNKRRMQRLQPDEVQGFEELPRATRHRTMRKGFVSLPDPEMIASRDDTVVFECELFNEEDNVQWQINGKSLNEFNDGRFSIQNYAYIRQLTIENVVPKDSGLKVQITLEGQTHQSKLTVEEVPVEFAEKLPRKVIANVGDTTATISAILTHDCANKISWYHNGQLLNTDNTYQIINEGCICTLLVREIDYKLGGRYSINADKVESSTILEVHGKPSMEFTDIGLQRIVIDANENLALKVKLKSLPEPEVDLYLNNELLTPELRTSVTILEESILVTRRELSRRDRGIYKLVLFNEYGEDSLEYDVYVRDVPDAPSGLMVTEVGHDYCFLKWNPPIASGVTEERERITGWVIEKKGANRRVWQRVGQLSAYSLEIFIEELDYDTDYVFRVAATNRFGVGEFSKLAQITTGTPFSAPVMHSAPRVSYTYEKSVRLEWDECWDTGGSPLFGYDVFCASKQGADWQQLNDSTVFTENFWVDEFLDAGKNGCIFKVEAQNYAGLHSDSNIVSEPLQIDERSLISTSAQQQMSVPKVTILGGTRVRVSWDMPGWLGSIVGAKHFVIQYRSEGTYLWNEVLDQFKQSPAIVEDELKEGVPYRIRVLLRSTGELGKEEISASAESEIIKISGFNVPILTKTLRDALIPKKDEVCLEICAVGEPSPLFVWLKNGEEIIPSPEYDNVSISNEGYASKLVIHRMGENDEGYYTCQISNEYGMVETKAFISMGTVQAHFINSFAEKITATEGKDVVLECEVSDPEASVKWTRNKRHIGETTNRITLEKQGYKRRLILYGSMKEDSGIYTCEIETASGTDKKVQTEIVVRPEKARIVFSPQGRTICHYGEKIPLYGDLSKSAEDVIWYKDGLPLQSKKCFAYFEGTKAMLEIYNFDESDVGEYSIALEGGEKSAPAKLRFEVSPKIELRRYHHEERIVKIGGDEFTVTANLLGWPTPKLSILLNDQPITDAKQVVVDAGVGCGEVHTINIRCLNRSHSGRIWLRASNEFGEDSAYIDLKVLDVPSAPINLRARNITSSSVDIYWNLTESDISNRGEEHIESFIVERKTGERQRWRQLQRKTADRIKTDTGEYVYTIQGLYPGESYAFRVLAFNEIGESEPSKTIDVDLPQEHSDDEEEGKMIEGIRRRLSSTELLQRKISETLPPLEKPSKPTITTDGLQTKAVLSWEKIDRAILYGIERRRLSASSEKDFWLEVANIERTTFIDRSIYETGRYVYRIVAKLPGVMNSEAGSQSEEVFITVQNVDQEQPHLERRRRVEHPEDSDASTSSSVQSLLDSGIQDDDGFHSPMKNLRKKISISKESGGGISGRRVSFAEDKKPKDEKKDEKFKTEMEEDLRPSSSSSYEFRGELDKMDEEIGVENENLEQKIEEKCDENKVEKQIEEKSDKNSEKIIEEKSPILKTEKFEELDEEKIKIEVKEEKEIATKIKPKIRKFGKQEETKVEAIENMEEKKIENEKEKELSSVGFEVPLSDTEAVEGQIRVELIAKMEKKTRDSLIRAKWFKDGKLLNTRTLKHKALLDNKGEAKLVINKVEKADEGLYKLDLEVTTKEQIKPSTQAYLTVRGKGDLPKSTVATKTGTTGSKLDEKVVTQEQQKIAPRFVKKPKPSVESIKGSRICLSGSFSGFPFPTIKWLRNGKEFLNDEYILLNNNYNEDLASSEFMLEILKFTPSEHEGTYTALIQNDIGTDSVSILVSELSLEDKMKHFGVSEDKLPEEENTCINNCRKNEESALDVAMKIEKKNSLVSKTNLLGKNNRNSKVELDCKNNNIEDNLINNKNIIGNNNNNIDNKDISSNNITNNNINDNNQNDINIIDNTNITNKNLNINNKLEIENDKNIKISNNIDNISDNNDKNINNKFEINNDKNIKISNNNINKNINNEIEINNNINISSNNINKNISDNNINNEIEINNNIDKNIKISNNIYKNISDNNNKNINNKNINRKNIDDNDNNNNHINNNNSDNNISLKETDSNSSLDTKTMLRKNAKMSISSTQSSSTFASISLDEDALKQQNSLSIEAATTTTNDDILGTDGDNGKLKFNGENLDNRVKDKQKTLEIVHAAIEQRNLKICRPRFFARPKPHKQIAEGKSLRLKTAISANPTPQVFWDKNCIRLESGSKYSIFQDGDFFLLEVHSLSIFDGGLYNCTVKNSEGVAFCSANVQVVELATPKSSIENHIKSESPINQRMKRQKSTRSEQIALEIVEKLPSEVKAIFGDQFNAECRVLGNPTPSIYWLFNNTRITPNSDHIVLSFDGESSKIIFPKVSSLDSGLYTCIAENSSGTVNTEMKLIVTKLIREDDLLAPKFLEAKKRIRHLESRENGIRQREIIMLAELIEGTEPILIKWFTPNRVEITKDYSSSYRIDRLGKDSRLTIFDAFPTDSGDYKCLAENKYGSSKCIFELKINEKNNLNNLIEQKPPSVSTKQSVIYAKQNQRFVDLIFTVMGYEPVICWYRIVQDSEQHIIPNTKKYEANNKENGQCVSLRIYDVQIKDASKYKIVAINRCGEASGIIELIVNQSTHNGDKIKSAL